MSDPIIIKGAEAQKHILNLPSQSWQTLGACFTNLSKLNLSAHTNDTKSLTTVQNLVKELSRFLTEQTQEQAAEVYSTAVIIRSSTTNSAGQVVQNPHYSIDVRTPANQVAEILKPFVHDVLARKAKTKLRDFIGKFGHGGGF